MSNKKPTDNKSAIEQAYEYFGEDSPAIASNLDLLRLQVDYKCLHSTLGNTIQALHTMIDYEGNSDNASELKVILAFLMNTYNSVIDPSELE